MTRTAPAKTVDAAFGEGRLRLARAYVKAARTEAAAAAAEDGDVGNSIPSQIVHAAIAFTDALTARYPGRVNRQVHAAAVKTFEDCLGNRLPASQDTRLRRI